MNSFPLKILTPEGVEFEGAVRSLTVRATGGDMGIWAGHADCAATLATGSLSIVTASDTRRAECEGGLLCVTNGSATVLPIGFQWIGL